MPGAGGRARPPQCLSGLTWDEATLDSYLENPKAFLKGNRMAFPGLKKPDDRENVIAYIKENGK